jgi:NADPH2:quinone reductase
MKAVVCKAWGLPETLVIEEQAEVMPAAGEVMIDIMAAGVNFPDVLIIQNKYQFKPELPFTPGNELAGIVRSVGEGVTKFKKGDRVFAFVPQGAFAQQIAVAEAAVLPMSEAMDFDTAAALTLTYGTSHHAIVDRAQLKAGETMLVLGAAGGVGLAAIEIGKAIGARPGHPLRFLPFPSDFAGVFVEGIKGGAIARAVVNDREIAVENG